MIEQNIFSNLIREFLASNFPEFLTSIKYQDDGSFDCSQKSNSKMFAIWIATYNSEITIGIEDPNGNTDIHTHIACYEIGDLQTCNLNLSTLINEIKNDQQILYKDENGKYNWVEIANLSKKNPSEIFLWNC